MSEKQKIAELVDRKKGTFIGVSDRVWGYAETRFDLVKSADEFCNVLKAEGFSVERGCGGMENAFIATFGQGKPVIGILAEYDALPNISQVEGLPEKRMLLEGGAGHGCGHNLLGAGALAGAVAIKDYMSEKNVAGTIKLFGCPAEESGSGKAFMARAGLFDGLDSLLTWHPMTETSIWGFSSLANYQVYFQFKGISAHAAAAPEHGRSALDAAELMSVGVNYLREHIIPEARIHYAYIDAGGISPNVVQPTSKVLYFIRAPRSSQVKGIYERVVKVAEGAAHMTETEMEVIWDSACAEYIINETLGRAMYANMEALGPIAYTDEEIEFARKFTSALGESTQNMLYIKLKGIFPNLDEDMLRKMAAKPIHDDIYPYSMTEKAMAGSTDVGDASWKAPTSQLLTACFPAGTVPHSWQYVACGKSSMAHKGMLYAGKVIAMTALDLLENRELVEKAKKEHSERLSGEPYYCPIPPEVHPR